MSITLLDTSPVTVATPATVSSNRQELIDGLNRDLAGEYQAIIMYIHYSAKLTGPSRRELRSLFQTEVTDEQGHAQFLADKIVAMGGEPNTIAETVLHVNKPQQMLETALAAEKLAIANYTDRIRQADACGEIGLKVSLENQLSDETRHREELERILAGWDELNLEQAHLQDQWNDDGGCH